MPAEGRGPDLRQARKVMRSRRLADGPATPLETVRKLQTSLQAKAKGLSGNNRLAALAFGAGILDGGGER